MRRSFALLGISGIVLASLSASAFTQKTPIAPSGHEEIIIAGAALAGGEVMKNESIPCASCNKYGLSALKTWSAVMGNRWVDIGGYSYATEGAKAKLKGWYTDCLDAAIQNADAMQYQHALRRKCDIGGPGLRRTHAGVVAVIKDRFYRAVSANDDLIWFRDGGGIYEAPYKASKASFLLGMALHALQDSFSPEHCERTKDWLKIHDYKTFVDTTNAKKHATEKDNPDKFSKAYGQTTPFENPKHGDFAFVVMHSQDSEYKRSELKETSNAAARASADLIIAFEAVRLAPRLRDMQWAAFEHKWLQLDETSDALKQAGDTTCVDPKPGTDSDQNKTEKQREICLAESGVEDTLFTPNADVIDPLTGKPMQSRFPKFCWPKEHCHDDALEHIAQAGKKAEEAAQKVVSTAASELGKVAQEVEDFFNHAPHSHDRCIGESHDFGRRGGDHFVGAALAKADQFWTDLGNAFDMLSLEDRKKAIDDKWKKVKQAVMQPEGNVRNGACSRVREWFTKGSSKNEGEGACRGDFDGHAAAVGQALDHLYDVHIHRGLPASGGGAKATSQKSDGGAAPLGPSHSDNRQQLLDQYKKDLELCKARLARTHFGHISGNDLCQQQYDAKRRELGESVPPPANESEDQKRTRIYEAYQACLRNPIGRAHNPGRQNELCKAAYEAELKAAGISAKPSDPTAGGPKIDK